MLEVAGSSRANIAFVVGQVRRMITGLSAADNAANSTLVGQVTLFLTVDHGKR